MLKTGKLRGFFINRGAVGWTVVLVGRVYVGQPMYLWVKLLPFYAFSGGLGTAQSCSRLDLVFAGLSLQRTSKNPATGLTRTDRCARILKILMFPCISEL